MKIQIPMGSASGGAVAQAVWPRFGLAENPFPEHGRDSGVLYLEHIADSIGRLNGWLNQVADATDLHRPGGRAAAVPAAAIFGSNGSGKSHLLGWLSRAAHGQTGVEVTRRPLSDASLAKLTLARLLVDAIPHGQAVTPVSTSLPMLDAIMEVAARPGGLNKLRDSLEGLSDGSPLRTPLAVLAHDPSDVTSRAWLAHWLRREYTTPSQRAKLGLAGVLQEEGQAIQAISDLLRVARHFGLLQVWMIFVDQLEELWTPAVSATKRARFLVDLRTLIDQAHEGAPVALMLAWNTRRVTSTYGASGEVEELIRRDYNALWERWGTPIHLRGLRDEDVWPFAQAYLRHVGVSDSSDAPRRDFYQRMERAQKRVQERLQKSAIATSGFRHTPRQVLAEWREEAQEVAKSP